MRSRKLFTLVLLAGTLGLGACAVGPDYRPPAMPEAAKPPFREAVTTGGVSTAPASSTWWTLYSDPILSRLIDDAFRYNTDIRVAAANLRLAPAHTNFQASKTPPT